MPAGGMRSEQRIPAHLQPLAVCYGLLQLLVPAGERNAVRLLPLMLDRLPGKKLQANGQAHGMHVWQLCQ